MSNSWKNLNLPLFFSSQIEFFQLHFSKYLIYPKYQHRGVGSALLRAVLDKYDHVRQIQLTTDNTQKTIGFYKSLGFREMSEIGCCGFMKI